VPQRIAVVGVFVAGDSLIEALPKQGQRIMLDLALLLRITEESRPVAAQLMMRVKAAEIADRRHR
jgi:hypothetical protein